MKKIGAVVGGIVVGLIVFAIGTGVVAALLAALVQTGWSPPPKIVSQGKLRIDCDFEGDVTGAEVIVSERAKVRGTVAGESVIVLGKIIGGIRGKAVDLRSSAHVEGDIHHTSLSVEKGAEITGRCRLSGATGYQAARV